eukprot:g33212.t1
MELKRTIDSRGHNCPQPVKPTKSGVDRLTALQDLIEICMYTKVRTINRKNLRSLFLLDSVALAARTIRGFIHAKDGQDLLVELEASLRVLVPNAALDSPVDSLQKKT